MNWKFWEWFDKGPPTQTLIEPRFEPMTDEKNILVLEDPVETPSANPEADRIRQQLLARRK